MTFRRAVYFNNCFKGSFISKILSFLIGVNKKHSMAVYTQLDSIQIQTFLQGFDVPALASFKGASDGVENSTFFLDLEDGSAWVLTLFETLKSAELPFYIDLLTFLHQQQLSVPCPLADKQGTVLQVLADKPALLFPRAEGAHLSQPNPAACAKVAVQLARMHVVTNHLAAQDNSNPRGLEWFQQVFTFVRPQLSSTDIDLIQQQLNLLTQLTTQDLPKGIIHGDLFRDNVLFSGEDISALIDFYNAGDGFLLLDVAIAFNDWCFDAKGGLLTTHAEAFLQSYQAVRPFTMMEQACWQEMLQIAACRFWLSRLKAVELQRQGVEQTLKDPLYYKKLLLSHSEIQANKS